MNENHVDAVRAWTRHWRAQKGQRGSLSADFTLSRAQVLPFLAGLFEAEERSACHARITVVNDTIGVVIGSDHPGALLWESDYLFALRCTAVAAEHNVRFVGRR